MTVTLPYKKELTSLSRVFSPESRKPLSQNGRNISSRKYAPPTTSSVIILFMIMDIMVNPFQNDWGTCHRPGKKKTSKNFDRLIRKYFSLTYILPNICGFVNIIWGISPYRYIIKATKKWQGQRGLEVPKTLGRLFYHKSPYFIAYSSNFKRCLDENCHIW